jgi:tRNA(His) 5'-end guanylyltransferase
MNDALGDRMKEYESQFAGVRFLPLLPVVARLDGKNFSTFTRGLRRPYDERLTNLMIDTTASLVEETNAVCGYTQSDEITLAWYSSSADSQIYFDGRVQKMVSVLAATCTAHFNAKLAQVLPEKTGKLPVFDCRVWQLPTLTEAANVFVWRELDATKNAITMAAQEFYSHTELHEKNGAEKQEMLFAKGVNFNDYPAYFKRGSYIQRRKVTGKFTAEDLEALPPKHHARTNPDLVVERTEYRRLDLPPILKVTNRVGVIFHSEEPIINTGDNVCDTASKSEPGAT